MLATLDQIESNQITQPAYHQEYKISDKKVAPNYHIKNVGLDQTPIIGTQVIGILRSLPISQTITEMENQGSQMLSVFETLLRDEDSNEDPQIVAARDSRITLLVKKYEGNTDREDNARLEILTQRLRKLSPIVTNHELTSATEIVDDLEAISSRLNTVMERYGLA